MVVSGLSASGGSTESVLSSAFCYLLLLITTVSMATIPIITTIIMADMI